MHTMRLFPRSSSLAVRRLRAVSVSVLAVALVFVTSLTAGLLLLNLPAARRLTMRELNRFFAAEFEGKLVIEHIENLRLDRADGVDVRISGADGTTLVVAHGVRGRIAPLALLHSVLRGSGDLQVEVFDIDAGWRPSWNIGPTAPVLAVRETKKRRRESRSFKPKKEAECYLRAR